MVAFKFRLLEFCLYYFKAYELEIQLALQNQHP